MTTLAVVSFEHVSGLPQDRMINTFHIGDGLAFAPLSNPQLTAVRDALQSFYLDITAPAVLSISEHFSTALSRLVAPKVRFYKGVVPPAKAGTPYGGLDFSQNLDPAIGINYPSEVAACLSYNAAPISGVDPRRLRGRIYLGPLTTASGQASAANEPQLATPFIVAMKAAAEKLEDDLVAIAGNATRWVVFSRGPFVATSSQVAQTNPVIGGHIDDAFDTQRRRGEVAGTRTLWA